MDSTSPPGLVVLSMTLSVDFITSSPFQYLISDNLQSCTDRSPSGETILMLLFFVVAGNCCQERLFAFVLQFFCAITIFQSQVHANLLELLGDLPPESAQNLVGVLYDDMYRIFITSNS